LGGSVDSVVLADFYKNTSQNTTSVKKQKLQAITTY